MTRQLVGVQLEQQLPWALFRPVVALEEGGSAADLVAADRVVVAALLLLGQFDVSLLWQEVWFVRGFEVDGELRRRPVLERNTYASRPLSSATWQTKRIGLSQAQLAGQAGSSNQVGCPPNLVTGAVTGSVAGRNPVILCVALLMG